MKKVRFGIIGAAQIAQRMHGPTIVGCPLSELVAVGSRSVAKAQDFVNAVGAGRARDSYEAVLQDAEVDAVVIALPNSMHAEWAIKAAQAGKHVLCEKPLATKVLDAEKMIAAAEASGVLLVEGFTHRFTPAMQWAREKILSGELGKPVFARAELSYSVQNWEADVRVQSSLDGGSLWDAGCYAVTALRFLLAQEPVSVHGSSRIHPRNGVDSTFHGVLTFPEGVQGIVQSSQETTFRCCAEVSCEKGRVVLPQFFSATEGYLETGPGKLDVTTFVAPNRFGLQLEDFCLAILGEGSVRFAASDALQNVKILSTLYESARNGSTLLISN